MIRTRDAVESNELQWDGRKRGHHEAYHLTVFEPDTGRAWWFRYSLSAPLEGEPTCALTGATYAVKEPAARFALRTEFPARQFATQSNGFHIRVSKSELSLGSAKGGLKSPTIEDHRLRWHLQFTDRQGAFAPLPKRSHYRGEQPPTKTTTPIPWARASGVIEVGGKRHSVQDAIVRQGHAWGNALPDSWVRAYATAFREDPDAWVDGVVFEQDGRQVLGIGLQDGHGRRLRLRARRLRRKGSSRSKEGVWNVVAHGGRWTLEGRFSASLQSLAGVTLPDPSGGQRFLHASAIGDATLELYRHTFGKRKLEATLTSRGTTLLEQGAMTPFDDVRFFA